jgi:hypothetical protein
VISLIFLAAVWDEKTRWGKQWGKQIGALCLKQLARSLQPHAAVVWQTVAPAHPNKSLA